MAAAGSGTDATRTFDWSETSEILRSIGSETDLLPSEDGRRLLGTDDAGTLRLEVALPLLQPIPATGWDLGAYFESLARPPGTIFVLLLQAGACAMGLWRDGRMERHKVIRKYVVRGTGRAQPGYLKTRGKSRYGSRLRLRNARTLLEETNAKMGSWWEAEGGFARAFASCPVRLWPELFAADPAPPFPRRGFHTRIPMSVKVPSFEELLRVWWHISHGRVTPTPPTEPQGPRR